MATISDEVLKGVYVRSGQLRTAEEISASKHMPSAQRLTELADSGFAPHYRIDGGPPLFHVPEIKDWIASHLTYRDPGVTTSLVVAYSPPKAALNRRPTALAQLENLREISSPIVGPGVYFLCHDDELRYVGQSVNPAARLGSHVYYGKKFNRVFFLPCPASELNDLERRLIKELQPPDNVVGKLRVAK